MNVIARRTTKPHELGAKRAKREWIYCTDAMKIAPVPGLYAVVVDATKAQMPLAIVKKDGNWTVYLGGEIITGPTPDWQCAFGWIYEKIPSLCGKKIEADEYRRLLTSHVSVVATGDKPKPVDLNETSIAL